MKTMQLESLAGDEITRTIRHAIDTAEMHEAEVVFTFNGVEIHARSNSDPELLYRDWSRGISQYHSDPVGPYPPPEMPAAVLARDAEIRAASEARARAASLAHEARQKRDRERLGAEIDGQEIRFVDDAAAAKWGEFVERNDDPYGAGVVQYADAWARLMQARMVGGDVAGVARQASRDADTDGITGFMYGCAVSALAECWIYGEALRRWHNLDTQIGNEGERANASGGTLNPALLAFG